MKLCVVLGNIWRGNLLLIPQSFLLAEHLGWVNDTRHLPRRLNQ